MVRGHLASLNAVKQNLQDLEFIKPKLPKESYIEQKQILENFASHLERSLKLWEGKNLKERLIGFKENGDFSVSKSGVTMLIALLPKHIGDILFKIIFCFKK